MCFGVVAPKLHDLLANEATRTEAVEIIRSLIDTVTLQPDPHGVLEVELVGDLARMIHLTQTTRNGPVSGAVHDEFLRSVKVVAGVGFEPTTFRL